MGNNSSMLVEIWSDVMCPFCYIGKRKFEAALNSFPRRDSVEIMWHSFLLSPHAAYQPGKDLYDHLADLKGQTREWAIKANNHVARLAKDVSLDFHFDRAKFANTFDAHRIVQFSKEQGLASEMEERLFKAYFTEGALLSDHATLVRLASETGLNGQEVAGILESNRYAAAVNQDVEEARQLGIHGVPFFIFNRKYAISGAQDPEVFSQVLHTLSGGQQ